jgi:hypothetical protein
LGLLALPIFAFVFLLPWGQWIGSAVTFASMSVTSYVVARAAGRRLGIAQGGEDPGTYMRYSEAIS